MTARYANWMISGAILAFASAADTWGQSQVNDDNRSAAEQSDDQTTNNSSERNNLATVPGESSQQSSNNGQQNADANVDQNQDPSAEHNRRTERQENREERRQEGGRITSRDRQPAIGVSVVQRGGLGVRVMTVIPGSPAADAGIRPGDTILEVEGRPVGSAQQLVSLIQNQEAGDTAEFAVVREGREYQVHVKLATREQALPPRLRRQDGSAARQQNESQSAVSEQNHQSEGQSNQYQQGQQQFAGEETYDGQQNYQYGSDQQDRGRFGPPQPPSPNFNGSQPNYNENQQIYYGGQRAGYSESPSNNGDERHIGERLAQRLTQFEQRLERLTQRLEEIERNGGIHFRAGSPDSNSYSNEDATQDESSGDNRESQEHGDQNHEDSDQ